MAKVLVAYFSQTGNTEKVARAIHDSVVSSGHDATLRDVQGLTVADLGGYDVIFLGSACHSSTLAEPVLEILSGIPSGSGLKMAGFATHSCSLPGGSDRDRELYETWASGCPKSFEAASSDTRIELLGYFGCQGAPSPPIEEFIHTTILPDDDEWRSYLLEARKHPDTVDLEEAGGFGRQMLAVYAERATRAK